MRDASNGSWQPMLTSEQAAAAVEVARDVAFRLRERDCVEAAIVAAAQQTAFPKSTHWEAPGVAQGYAGLAIMCSYLDACFPDDDWDAIGHEYLTFAAQGAERQTYLPTGLFSGLSGLAFAAWSLSRRGTRYRKLIASIEEAFLPQTVALAEQLSQQRHGVSVGQFDVISGLAGVGAYLLCRRDAAAPAAALQAVLRSFVALTQEEAGVPRWHTPPRLMADEMMLRQYPNGNLNCGLAHGIPGPLAVLALAYRAGVVVEGQADAIDRVAGWLACHRADDAWGVNWPTAVPLNSNADLPGTETASHSMLPSRTAWCYGSPGVARALWLVGEALDNQEYRDLAVTAMEAVYRRPLAERRIDSPTFCHGVAGLLQITLRFAHDTGRPCFTEAARALNTQLLAEYDPDTRLGYYSLEPGMQRVDQPGLLDGVPGVVLVLLAAATDKEPSWDRLFLLS